MSAFFQFKILLEKNRSKIEYVMGIAFYFINKSQYCCISFGEILVLLIS